MFVDVRPHKYEQVFDANKIFLLFVMSKFLFISQTFQILLHMKGFLLTVAAVVAGVVLYQLVLKKMIEK